MDLSIVHEIGSLEPSVVNSKFLQRCRSLSIFAARSVERACFDWAVQEEKELEASLGQGTVVNVLPSATDSSSKWNPVDASSTPVTLPVPLQTAFVTRPLVPLVKLNLYDCDIEALPDIDAIATAFCDTLETLLIKFKPTQGPIETIIAGQGCTADLPCLTKLQ